MRCPSPPHTFPVDAPLVTWGGGGRSGGGGGESGWARGVSSLSGHWDKPALTTSPDPPVDPPDDRPTLRQVAYRRLAPKFTHPYQAHTLPYQDGHFLPLLATRGAGPQINRYEWAKSKVRILSADSCPAPCGGPALNWPLTLISDRATWSFLKVDMRHGAFIDMRQESILTWDRAFNSI